MNGTWAFPWEQAASRGNRVPDGLSLADQMAYISMRGIYQEFYAKRLDRESASAEKRMVFRRWEKAREAEAFDKKLTACYVRLLKNTELAASACRKNPTPENALRLCDIIDGLER